MIEEKNSKLDNRIVFFEEENCYQILLNNHFLHTPCGLAVKLPTYEIAWYLCQEMDKQKRKTDIKNMPVNRFANTVLDGVQQNIYPLFEDILKSFRLDLIFHRARCLEKKSNDQDFFWDQINEWFYQKTGSQISTLKEVTLNTSDSLEINRLANFLKDYLNPFTLTALHMLIGQTKSVIIALALGLDEIRFNEEKDCFCFKNGLNHQIFEQKSKTEIPDLLYKNELDISVKIFQSLVKINRNQSSKWNNTYQTQ